jgi:hypothetical protein
MQHCKCYTKDALYFYILLNVYERRIVFLYSIEMCVNDALYFYIL